MREGKKTDREQFQKACGKIVAKAWSDEGFKRRLLSDPRAVLKENGIDVPEDIQVKVVENTKELVYVTVPPRPDATKLVTEDVAQRVVASHFYFL